MRAFRAKTQRDRPADPSPGAGHNCHFIVQASNHIPLPSL
jgi:hypothetical protein